MQPGIPKLQAFWDGGEEDRYICPKLNFSGGTLRLKSDAEPAAKSIPLLSHTQVGTRAHTACQATQISHSFRPGLGAQFGDSADAAVQRRFSTVAQTLDDGGNCVTCPLTIDRMFKWIMAICKTHALLTASLRQLSCDCDS